ncbi:MAG: purine-binding chemotaxis protein CheW [Anaerolineae bacterium]|nr:purine-binding chemotaxis protein CheW [Gloeobacterales cyanobacterium ES-bin-313]
MAIKRPLISPPLELKEQFLAFALDDQSRGLVAIHQVVEVLSVPSFEIISLPQMSECIVGVYNWRGEILWMVDLSEFLGYPQTPTARQMVAIVVHVEGLHMGWIVSKVEDTVWHPRNAIQPAPPMAFAPEIEPYLRGYLLQPNGDTSLILDAAAILRAPLWQTPC